MLFEWRVYKILPKKMNMVHNLFRNTTLKLFEKHGIKAVGFWEAVVGTSNILYYMLAWQDMAHMEKAWSAFRSDPEWIEARREAVKDGPLTERVTSILLKPTAYSPMK